MEFDDVDARFDAPAGGVSEGVDDVSDVGLAHCRRLGVTVAPPYGAGAEYVIRPAVDVLLGYEACSTFWDEPWGYC